MIDVQLLEYDPDLVILVVRHSVLSHSIAIERQNIWTGLFSFGICLATEEKYIDIIIEYNDPNTYPVYSKTTGYIDSQI